MSIGYLLSKAFEKIPEWPVKNDLRYFLAFNKLMPNFISDISPVKGYELNRKLKPGDIVVDAGAYPGDYAVFASRKVGESGKVICFEPDVKNIKILKKNLEKEGRSNFIILPKGLWNKNTKLKIKTSDGLHTTLSKTTGEQEIEVARLDDELKKLAISRIDVLKMDIEGAEIEAIQGAKETLKKSNCYVAIASYHIVNGKTTSHFLEKYLKNLSYHSHSAFPKHLTTYGWKL
mgnify:CR=1 FL=1